jgi:hypothetical protein
MPSLQRQQRWQRTQMVLREKVALVLKPRKLQQVLHLQGTTERQ